eukprot:426653_1
MSTVKRKRKRVKNKHKDIYKEINPTKKRKLIRCGAKWNDLEEKQLLKLYKSNNYTLNEIANKLGRTQNAVSARLEFITSNNKNNNKNDIKKLQLNLKPIKGCHIKKSKPIIMKPIKIDIKYHNRKHKHIINNNIKVPKNMKKVSHLSDLPKHKMGNTHILDTIMTCNSDTNHSKIIFDRNSLGYKNKIEPIRKQHKHKHKHKKRRNKKINEKKQCLYFQNKNGCCRYQSDCKFSHNIS